MTPQQTADLLRSAGALLEGHFGLSSGLHSSGYVQSALVLQHPASAAALGEALAVRAHSWQAEVVLAPALGGIVIGHEVARALGVRSLFAERVNGQLLLRRGFTVSPGERVLVAEDVLTTGKSTRETIQVARRAGADVVGAVAIVDRGSGGAALELPFEALLTRSYPAYAADACPLCAAGVPLVKPGSRPDL